MPVDEFNDDYAQSTSTTLIHNNRETDPLIVKPPKKWLFFFRSVETLKYLFCSVNFCHFILSKYAFTA